MIYCNEWKTKKCHKFTNMGKVKRFELWWQLHLTWLPVRDLQNFRPLDFCWTECTGPYLIIKNLVTDRDISVNENSNMTNFGNQGHSRGTPMFSTIPWWHIKLLGKGMLPACNTDHNVGRWHDTSPAYLYRYDNWHLQQEVTLVARLWRTERRYGWRSYTKVTLIFNVQVKYTL